MRVSTTSIEAYRRVMETEYGSEIELMAQIRGERVEMPWRVHAGSAWHAALETGQPRDLTVSAYYFADDHVQAGREWIGPGVWEVKATRIFYTPYGPVTVVAQADHCRGLFIQENKTKFSTPDARDYETSLQWRFELLVHEAALVRYNLFDFADPKEGYCELRNITSFKFWPYAEMENDCMTWLESFLVWADTKSLLGFLERRGSTPVLA